MTERCPCCHRPLGQTSRSADPATSRAAGADAEGREGAVFGVRPGSHRARMLVAYWNAPAGLSDVEAAEAAGLDLPGVCWWKRASELRQGGFVEPFGTITGPNGADVMVCRITEAGERRARELKRVTRGR